MKVILLAAGLGTRLRPLTDSTPKCLMPIKGVPLLEIWLQRLEDAGLGPYLINTHYLHEQVESYVRKSKYKKKISLSYEPNLLGTAATLIANLSFYKNEDGILIHADNYCLEDFRSFVSAHRDRPSGCIMTMMTFRTTTPESCGITEIDRQGVLTEFHEKVINPPGNLANGAIYALSPELMELLKTEYSTARDNSTEIIPRLVAKIYTFETVKPLIDIGTIKAYQEVNGI
jgi:mannose-1-phosphate guanylyltransferase